mmetsp:Transcript_81147/g.160869  ORF Transcript_81147/g.160869 Transcript_81147/m.160869 type:complete len:264 (-) Transcript_81147:928-1719(-)
MEPCWIRVGSNRYLEIAPEFVVDRDGPALDQTVGPVLSFPNKWRLTKSASNLDIHALWIGKRSQALLRPWFQHLAVLHNSRGQDCEQLRGVWCKRLPIPKNNPACLLGESWKNLYSKSFHSSSWKWRRRYARAGSCCLLSGIPGLEQKGRVHWTPGGRSEQRHVRPPIRACNFTKALGIFTKVDSSTEDATATDEDQCGCYHVMPGAYQFLRFAQVFSLCRSTKKTHRHMQAIRQHPRRVFPIARVENVFSGWHVSVIHLSPK